MNSRIVKETSSWCESDLACGRFLNKIKLNKVEIYPLYEQSEQSDCLCPMNYHY